MAIRQIRMRDDEILRKRCKEVKKFDEKLGILLDDMYDTMTKAEGVGLAAPQVGILKRVVVIDIGDGRIELINPEIIETSGKQNGSEGCLSFPKLYGEVERPNYVKVKAQDRNGKWFTAEGEELLARAFCHECDHLDGHVFTEKVTKYVN
jgi:peptide deformylase